MAESELIAGVATGFAALGASVKYIIDRIILYRNGKKEEPKSPEETKLEELISLLDHKLVEDVCLKRTDHDRECDLKLKPMWAKLNDIHMDVKEIKNNGKAH
jgi:hypothetical protein